MSEHRTDFDSPWKSSIESYFPDFIAFFFPHIQSEIDWSRAPEFLDTELQQVVRDAELGKRLADKLVKVWRVDGSEVWVLIHIEVQNAEERNFADRMFVYNYRLRDRYNQPICSLACWETSDRTGDRASINQRCGAVPSHFNSRSSSC